MLASTLERLVRLRALLRAATGATAETTPIGRHAAVVALDGVNELAMGLSLLHLGNTKPHSFPGLVDGLRKDLGERWKADVEGLAGIEELHRARNALQHHGLLPDASHIPIWATETERFIRSIVRVVFGVELAVVATADAVQDPRLRLVVKEAEDHLADGDFRSCVASSWRAVETAVRGYRELLGSRTAFRSAAFDGFTEFRAIQSDLENLAAWADAASLAPDINDWLWLRSAQGGERFDLSEVHAQRAVVLALSCALRLEAMRSQRPRRAEPPKPSLHEDYRAPTLGAIKLGEGPGLPDRARIEVHLENVPPDWWSAWNREAMDRAPRRDLLVHRWSGDRVLVQASPEVTPSEIARVLKKMVSKTHDRFLAGLEDARRAETMRTRELHRAQQIVAEQPALFGEVVETWIRGEVKPRITVRVPTTVDTDVLRGALSDRGVDVAFDPDHRLVVACGDDFERLAGLVREAATLAEKITSDRRTEQEAAERQRETFRAELDRQIRSGGASHFDDA